MKFIPNKSGARATCSIIALALCGAIAMPAKAQQSKPGDEFRDRKPDMFSADGYKKMMQQTQEVESAFAETETSRLAGDCKKHENDLLELGRMIAKITADEGLIPFSNEAKTELHVRFAEAQARSCPSLAGPAKPETAVAVTPSDTKPADPPPPVTREPGQTRTLDDLKIEYAAASCGTEEEKKAARDRLLTALDRAIAIERSPQKRDRLLEQRQRVADGTVGQKQCPKPAEPEPPNVGQAGPPVTLDELGERAALRFSIVKDIEKAFNLAERARLRGDCTYRDNVLGSIRMKLGKPVDGAGAPDDADAAVWEEWRSRLADAEARPCPPPATPPSPVGMLPDRGVSVQEYRDREAQVARDIDDARKRRTAAFLAAYYGFAFLPRTGIGVRRDGAPGAAPEVDAGRTARRVNSLGISAGFQTKIDPGFDLRVTGIYNKGDAKTDISVPATSSAQRVDTGIVYGRLSNGSSGVIAGGGGVGSTKTDLTNWGLKAEIGHDLGSVRVAFGAEYEQVDTKHDLSFASSLVSGGFTFNFGQDRLQKLDETYVGVYGSAEATIPLCPDADLKLEVVGGPYRRNTDFSGWERNTANFGPMGNRDFILDFREEDKGWSAKANAGAQIEYRLKSSLSLTAGAGVHYRSDVGKVVNPNSGDQVFFLGQTTRLERDDAWGWGAAVGVRHSF